MLSSGGGQFPFTDHAAGDFAAKVSTNPAGFFRTNPRAAAEVPKQGPGHTVRVTASLMDQPVAGVRPTLCR